MANDAIAELLIEKHEMYSRFHFVENKTNPKLMPFPNNKIDLTPISTLQTEIIHKNKKMAFSFTEKEILKMPKKYRKLFRTHKINGHVRLRTNGVYEIRCQINKKPITATSKSLEQAKLKFIEILQSLDINNQPIKPSIVYFNEYAEKWLVTAKMPFVKEITYKEYERTLKTDISPHFINRELASIKQIELQEILNTYTETKRFRTAKKLHQMLSAIFDYAVTDELIRRSPMERVKIVKYEQERGVPLTREEEAAFISAFLAEPSILRQAFVLILYTGIRRSELSSVKIINGWIHLTSSKQVKGKSEKQRSIPISPMLAPLLPQINLSEIVKIPINSLTIQFKKICPSHHLHDLRHTFITRAQECGIRREIVSLWAGHSADTSTTSIVYTHLEQNKEHQLEEMKRFKYNLNPILDPTFCE